ncbi:MAG: hypothetical protein K2Q17_13090 [Nitrospiraceae bacterium]|nr:hypothetical protein [Nitrospiraceae bacterium]
MTDNATVIRREEERPERLDALQELLNKLDDREEIWPSETLAIGGAVVSIGYNGKTNIDRGLIRPEDAPTLSIVHPREVFKPAILLNSAAIICAHNHPSGDPEPSSEDRVLTARLRQAGDLIGITVLDHVILGDDRTFSFADQGWLA